MPGKTMRALLLRRHGGLNARLLTVSFPKIIFSCGGPEERVFSIKWTSINGIIVLLCADLTERGHLRQYAHCGQSRLPESYDLISTCPPDTLEQSLAHV